MPPYFVSRETLFTFFLYRFYFNVQNQNHNKYDTNYYEVRYGLLLVNSTSVV